MPKKRLPKKIAGVKVPKKVRKSAIVTSLLESDAARKLAADMLLAAAGAIAAVLVQNNSREIKATGKSVRRTGQKGSSLVQDVVKGAAGAVTGVLGEAARSMLTPEPSTKSKTKNIEDRSHRQRH